MSSDPDLEHVQRTSELSIVEAKQNLDTAIRRYTTLRQIYPEGSGELESARAQLHTAVLDLHWKMRGETEAGDHWETMEDAHNWESEYLWTGEHPVTGNSVIIDGLSDLDDWIEESYEREVPFSGPKHAGKDPQTRDESLRLPAPAALAAAKVLVREFNSAGWDAETRTPVAETEPI